MLIKIPLHCYKSINLLRGCQNTVETVWLRSTIADREEAVLQAKCVCILLHYVRSVCALQGTRIETAGFVTAYKNTETIDRKFSRQDKHQTNNTVNIGMT